MLLYYLVHKRKVEPLSRNNWLYSTKALGFFRSKVAVKRAIDRYKQLMGFNRYPNGFKIFAYHCRTNRVKNIYFLQHEYYNERFDCDIVTSLGVYLSKDYAQKLIEALIQYPKCTLSNYPEVFCIDKYKINELYWPYGFD